MNGSLAALALPVLQRGTGLGDVLDPRSLQAQSLTLLADFESRSRAAGHSRAQSEEARYALCAFLDERILADSPIGMEWLGHSLSLREFGDMAAGSGFFDRGEALARESPPPPALEVHLACLLLGFRGRFRFEPPETLAAKVADLRRACGHDSVPAPPKARRRTAQRSKEPRLLRLLERSALAILLAAVLAYLLLAAITRLSLQG